MAFDNRLARKAAGTMRRFTVDIAPVLALVAILLASTSMMNSATEDSTSFGEMYSVLLIVNAVDSSDSQV